MPPTAQDGGTIKTIVDALQQLTQAQTDTLALIVVIVFLVVTGLLATLGYLVYKSRTKIVIPQSGDKPNQIVSEKEFIGILYNTFLGRLETLNSQNDTLNARLEQSLKANDATLPILDKLVKWTVSAATSTDVQLASLSVDKLSSHIDSKLEEMKEAKEGLGTKVTNIDDTTTKLAQDVKEILGKVNEVSDKLNELTTVKTELTELATIRVELEAIKLRLNDISGIIVGLTKDKSSEAIAPIKPDEVKLSGTIDIVEGKSP